MGNVMAASNVNVPPPPNIVTPPPPPPTVNFAGSFPKPEGPGKPSSSEESTGLRNVSETREDGLENPGTMEELHKKCKEVFPSIFEGAKLMLNKGLSNHFQVSHTVNMSSIAPSGYRFGATYVGTKQFSPNEVYPVLLGDIDPSGNLNANILHQFGSVRTKFATQINNSKFTAAQLTADYRGSDFTASLTMGNIDILNESGVFVAHYLQSVTRHLALGAELAYQYGPNVPGGEIAVLSAAARYTGNDYALSGSFGGNGLHLCFYQKASEQLQVGVELETNFRVQEAITSIGYQVDLPKADLCFRGMLDSNWTVGAVLEKKLPPLPFSFVLSGTMNHSKNQFRLGCGLIIG